MNERLQKILDERLKGIHFSTKRKINSYGNQMTTYGNARGVRAIYEVTRKFDLLFFEEVVSGYRILYKNYHVHDNGDFVVETTIKFEEGCYYSMHFTNGEFKAINCEFPNPKIKLGIEKDAWDIYNEETGSYINFSSNLPQIIRISPDNNINGEKLIMFNEDTGEIIGYKTESISNDIVWPTDLKQFEFLGNSDFWPKLAKLTSKELGCGSANVKNIAFTLIKFFTEEINKDVGEMYEKLFDGIRAYESNLI